MASILQRVGALNQKACTFTFGASAAAHDNAGPARVPLGRPSLDFTRSFLVGNSGFSLAMPEHLQTGLASKLPTFSVRATARDLLPRPQNGQSSTGLEMKQCLECKRAKPLVDYEKAGKGLKRSCRACVAKMRAERSGKEMAHMAMSVEESWKRAKPCLKCGLVKELRDFAMDKRAGDGVQNRCRACKATYAAETDSIAQPEDQGQGPGQNAIETANGASAELHSDHPGSGYLSSEEDEASLERQFEVTKNLWETLLADKDEEPPVLVPDVVSAPPEPISQQTRSIASDAASETIAALQVKLLRLDFDLSHARATKAVFSDQVDYLERVMSTSTEENENMRIALKEASSSIADLESHVERLEEEGRNLRGRLLHLDFDLTHTRAAKTILGNKVDDLERAIAEDNEESRIRDEKLSTALAEATASNAALRAQVEEAQSESSNLLSKVLTFSLDLDHSLYGKTMLSNRVQDLERSLNDSEEAFKAREEGVKRALEESNVAIAELETLRENHNTLLSRSIRSDFDLEHHKYGKQVLNDKVAQLERTVNDIREEDETLKAALAKATASNIELEAQVTGLQDEAQKLKTKVLNFSFDLTHSGATRGILSERVKDLERMVSEYTDSDVKLRESLAESAKAVAEVARLEAEGGALKSKLLRLDLDLAHARAHKDVLGDKVEVLERMVEELRTDDAAMRASLAEAVSSNAALEAEVTDLQLESTNLRNKVLYLNLDLTNAQAGRSILADKVQDLEKELGDVQTQEEKLKAAHALTEKLESEVERLSSEEKKLLNENLRKDFDLAHLTALKGILEKRVSDIDDAIAARDEAEANMKAAFAARDQALEKMADLDEQRSKFREQSLRKDFDNTHLKALKAILSDRVADLERVVAVHEDIDVKLKESNLDKAELAAEVERLTEEGRSLQSKLLQRDFDMTHTRALTAILQGRVEDLEKEIVEKNIMAEQLAETRADKAKLESDVQRLDTERNALQSESIRKDFDLMQLQSLKALLEDKVQDLERIAEEHTDMGLKLKDVTLTNAVLEAELQRLETQEGALRSQMLSRDFDLTQTRTLKDHLQGRVQELEKMIETHNDLGKELTVVKSNNAQLQAQIERFKTRDGKILSLSQAQDIGPDFDRTHFRALKAILEGRVEDLEKTIAAHEDLSEQLQASHLANTELEREVDRLGTEGKGLRSKLLQQDFDLTNTRALKKILNEKVEDLERVIADHDDMGAKLRASKSENLQLSGRVARLEETEGELKNKLMWKDLDLQHYHALKTILDDKVQGLEKAVADLDEAARIRDEKLQFALAEASVSTTENAALKEETDSLKFRLFSTDLDLTHALAGKAILSDKVQDLERVLANYDELALARDASLAEALSSVDELEAEVARLEHERGLLESRNIRMDFDLKHVSAIKSILGEKVVDLETKGEELTTALTEAIESKTELEGKVGELSDGLKAVMKEEKTLRGSQAELKRQLFNLRLDNLALHRSTQARTEMLEDKQQKLAELETALAQAQEEAAALNRQLEVAVTQSGGKVKAAGIKESVGDRLAQIASLTAAVRNETEGTRVQLAESGVDTDEEVVDSDNEGETKTAPSPEKSKESSGAGKGLVAAGFSAFLVLALGGSVYLNPTAAKSFLSDFNLPSAAVDRLVPGKDSTPPKYESTPPNKDAPAVKASTPALSPVDKNAPAPAKVTPAGKSTEQNAGAPAKASTSAVKQTEQVAAASAKPTPDGKSTEKVADAPSKVPAAPTKVTSAGKSNEEVAPAPAKASTSAVKPTEQVGGAPVKVTLAGKSTEKVADAPAKSAPAAKSTEQVRGAPAKASTSAVKPTEQVAAASAKVTPPGKSTEKVADVPTKESTAPAKASASAGKPSEQVAAAPAKPSTLAPKPNEQVGSAPAKASTPLTEKVGDAPAKAPAASAKASASAPKPTEQVAPASAVKPIEQGTAAPAKAPAPAPKPSEQVADMLANAVTSAAKLSEQAAAAPAKVSTSGVKPSEQVAAALANAVTSGNSVEQGAAGPGKGTPAAKPDDQGAAAVAQATAAGVKPAEQVAAGPAKPAVKPTEQNSAAPTKASTSAPKPMEQGGAAPAKEVSPAAKQTEQAETAPPKLAAKPTEQSSAAPAKESTSAVKPTEQVAAAAPKVVTPVVKPTDEDTAASGKPTTPAVPPPAAAKASSPTVDGGEPGASASGKASTPAAPAESSAPTVKPSEQIVCVPASQVSTPATPAPAKPVTPVAGAPAKASTSSTVDPTEQVAAAAAKPSTSAAPAPMKPVKPTEEEVADAPTKASESPAAPVPVKASTPVSAKRFLPPVNPIEQVAMAMVAPVEEVDLLEESALLEGTATGPTEEQQAEEMSLVEEMSSKLFEASPGSLPSSEAIRPFVEPECKVDMC